MGRFSFPFSTRLYFRCPTCDLIYLVRAPEWRNDKGLSYYQEDYFDQYADDQPIRDKMHLNSRILDVIEKHCTRGRLLDIGCGCGFFLRTAKDRGWSVSGVDPSEQSIAKARELVGDAASVGTLQNVNIGSPFDVVTMINVLDHLREPWKDLSRVVALLRPGGCLYLRFSNGLFHSSIIRMQATITEKSIMNRLLVFHEYAFTPTFIRKLLEELGFEDRALYNAQISGAALHQHSPILRFLSRFLKCLLWLIIIFLKLISGNRWLLGPSLEVTAVKRGK